MNDPNRNARWGRIISEELVRGGVSHAVLCPGSRNTPLLFALAGAFGGRAISHVDERSAGFLALGLIRASGRPVAVCVTSGSALANLLPAVCEAAAAGLPLIVLSADRPWELQDCGAPQTMPQRGILAAFVRRELDLGEPADDERCLRALRRGISTAAQALDGPSHVNIPLRDPLPPLADPSWNPPAVSAEAADGRPGPFTVRVAATTPTVAAQPWMRPGLRGLVIAGNGPLADCENIEKTAEFLQFPLLADGASGVRRPSSTVVVCHHDALVGSAPGTPEVVILLGQGPLTRAVTAWLERQECPLIVLGGDQERDLLGRSWLTIAGDPAAAFAALAPHLASGDPAWLARWRAADAAAAAHLSTTLDHLGWSEAAVIDRALTASGFAFVHLASSMAVRYANLLLRPDPRPVTSNRGVNGIDGTLGTFLGLAHGHRTPGLLLCGDLAALHDLPALAAAPGCRGAIVLLNNGGGGIFDHLAVAAVPGYERWVRTSHDLRFAGAAAMFGLAYTACTTLDDLAAALTAAGNDGRLHLIECLLPGTDGVAQLKSLLQTG